jgi:hypothetical protein
LTIKTGSTKLYPFPISLKKDTFHHPTAASGRKAQTESFSGRFDEIPLLEEEGVKRVT